MRTKKIYSVSISVDTMETIKQMAKSSNTKVSAYVEKMMKDHINSEKPLQQVIAN